MELCRRFSALIRHKANQVYRPRMGYLQAEWHHEALTIFIELLLSDYQLKENGGSAFFGHYIKSKLYYRLLDKAQKIHLHSCRETVFETDDLSSVDLQDDKPKRWSLLDFDNRSLRHIGIDKDGNTVRSALRVTPTEVFGGIVSNFRGSNDPNDIISADSRREEIVEEATGILEIAKRILNNRDYDIFEMMYASGMVATEIAALISPTVSVRQIRRIAQHGREKVLIELGKLRIRRKLD